MKARRYFVTYVLFLGIALILALHATRMPLEAEANSKIAELKSLDANLERRAAWDLSAHSLEERRQLKQDLAHYLSALNRVFEIGSMRHLILENREELISRRDRFELAQKNIEQFEVGPKKMANN